MHRRGRERSIAAFALAFFGTTLAASSTFAAGSSTLGQVVPRLDHIIVVVMENKTYDQVRVLPYAAGLIASYASFSNSYGLTHPSQPNYLALWGGDTFGVTSDACPAPGSPYSAENLGHACEAAGLTWRAYSENLPEAGSSVCTADNSLYTRKHDPWTNFSNLDHLNERPYSDLAADISGGTLPNLAFVIPNNCDDSHNTTQGCTAEFGDTWLSNNVPAMIQAVGNGIVVLTWDEDDSSLRNNNHILTVFAGPPVQSGYVSTQILSHYTVLRMICEALGIQPFGFAAGQFSITDVWRDVTSARRDTWGRLKLLYR